MILSLLNKFALYRESVSARMRAEDAARHSASRAEAAERRAAELQAELLDTHKKLEDALMLKLMGMRVYEKNDPPQPLDHEPSTMSRFRPHAAAVAAARNAQTMQELRDFFKEETVDANNS